jgi:hypothetical protein
MKLSLLFATVATFACACAPASSSASPPAVSGEDVAASKAPPPFTALLAQMFPKKVDRLGPNVTLESALACPLRANASCAMVRVTPGATVTIDCGGRTATTTAPSSEIALVSCEGGKAFVLEPAAPGSDS